MQSTADHDRQQRNSCKQGRPVLDQHPYGAPDASRALGA
jgi:hypothetical protein